MLDGRADSDPQTKFMRILEIFDSSARKKRRVSEQVRNQDERRVGSDSCVYSSGRGEPAQNGSARAGSCQRGAIRGGMEEMERKDEQDEGRRAL